MSMKDAFDMFFEEMTQNYINEWGVPPRAPYTEEKIRQDYSYLKL